MAREKIYASDAHRQLAYRQRVYAPKGYQGPTGRAATGCCKA